jgi:hypothetical protein
MTDNQNASDYLQGRYTTAREKSRVRVGSALLHLLLFAVVYDSSVIGTIWAFTGLALSGVLAVSAIRDGVNVHQLIDHIAVCPRCRERVAHGVAHAHE